MNAEWEFLAMLKDEGRRSAGWFLAEHADDLGKRSTDDIDALLNKVAARRQRGSPEER